MHPVRFSAQLFMGVPTGSVKCSSCHHSHWALRKSRRAAGPNPLSFRKVRKEIFARALISYVPLAAHIRRLARWSA